MLRDRRKIAIISTGGTIEKTYDELQGVMLNGVSNLDVLLATLRLDHLEIIRVPLMSKDSLEMNAADHELIADTAQSMAQNHDGVIVVHGTDTLSETGEVMCTRISDLQVPIILTGAMRPFVMRHTDAQQNLTEALLAVQICDPGVYVAMHGRVLKFPGVIKDRQRMTFVRAEELPPGAR